MTEVRSMSRNTKLNSSTNSRGAAVVEFAVILPIFIYLIAAAVDFSFFLLANQQVRGAARAGAEYVFSHDYNDCGIQVAAISSVTKSKLLKFPQNTTTCALSPTGGIYAATIASTAWCGCSGDTTSTDAPTIPGYICPSLTKAGTLCPNTAVVPALYFSVTITADYKPFFGLFQRAKTITKTVYGRGS